MENIQSIDKTTTSSYHVVNAFDGTGKDLLEKYDRDVEFQGN